MSKSKPSAKSAPDAPEPSVPSAPADAAPEATQAPAVEASVNVRESPCPPVSAPSAAAPRTTVAPVPIPPNLMQGFRLADRQPPAPNRRGRGPLCSVCGAPMTNEGVRRTNHPFRVAVHYKCDEGYLASASVEPALDHDDLPHLVNDLLWACNGSIWIGLMRHVRQRVRVETEEDRRHVERIEQMQSDQRVLGLVYKLRGIERVRWKDSMQEVMARHTA